MKHERKLSWVILMILISSGAFLSCNKDEKAEGTDLELYNLAKETSGYTWYKNSDDLLNKSAGSGHSQAFLRTRYNTEATSQFDSVGKIKSGTVFPENSVIVKELYGSATALEAYAILFKQTGHADADANGWVWGYLNADGTVKAPASEKGSGCISCHLQADNIDYTLMNKYFP